MEKTKKIAGIQFTNTGILIERAYCTNAEFNATSISEEIFTGEFLTIAKRLLKYRMAHCYKQLHTHLASAGMITEQVIAWKGGHFSVPAWEAMEAALQLDDVRKLDRFQCQQIIRSMLLNADNYCIYDHDENWNKLDKSSSIKLSEDFKLFITEQALVVE